MQPSNDAANVLLQFLLSNNVQKLGFLLLPCFCDSSACTMTLISALTRSSAPAGRSLACICVAFSTCPLVISQLVDSRVVRLKANSTTGSPACTARLAKFQHRFRQMLLCRRTHLREGFAKMNYHPTLRRNTSSLWVFNQIGATRFATDDP